MIVHGTDRHQRLGQVLEGPKWIVGVRETPPSSGAPKNRLGVRVLRDPTQELGLKRVKWMGARKLL